MRKRRHRTLSVEAEIRQRAAQIQRDQMSEAMKAAALMIVGRKLDEIRTILQGMGLQVQPQRQIVAAPVVGATESTVPAIQHPCSYCGRESVYRTKPHRFNRTGTWLCQAHYPLRRQHETASTASAGQVLEEGGAIGAPIAGNHAQDTGAVINGGPTLPPDKPDTGGDVGIADAFAAVGIQTNAQ